MSKGKKEIKSKYPAAKQKQANADKNKKRNWLIIGSILLITFICYVPSFENEFTNWDDPTYVTENKLLTSLSSQNIKTIFNPKTEVSLNYHPVTILSLAINYRYSKLNPRGYFITNLLFHLLNILLVFIFIYKLSGNKTEIAALVAAWFGLHPMHVESVAWISERKDVLYTFFFLASAICYLKFSDEQKTKWIVYSFFLFLLSCLSKAMAVSLVPVLFLIDYLKGKSFSVKQLLPKIPFVLLALVIGYYAVVVQSKEAMNEFDTFTLAQRFMFAAYGFILYMAKIFAPFNLSAFYPYPNVNDLGNIPQLFYFAPFIAIAIIAIPVFLVYRFGRSHLPVVIFGFAFYFFTIALVLQFISVGSAIMAERYSYVPYIGITFMVAYGLHNYFSNKKNVLLAIGVFTSLVLAYLCYNRVQVWKNNETLWTDVIEKYPHRIEVAYKNRGNYYAQIGKLDQAYEDHMILMNMKTRDAGVYTNFANICGLRKEFDKALEAYTHALELKTTDNYDIYLNRAITYSMMKQYDKALADFDVADKMKPNDEKLYMNRAYVYLSVGMYEKSIGDYDFLVQHFPDDKMHYFNRGLAKFNLKRFADAALDFTEAMRLDPNYKEACFNLSVSYNQLGRYKEALAYAQKARSLGHPINDSYFKELETKVK